jgi:predicted nucleotidyltransferase component of viral defense system
MISSKCLENSWIEQKAAELHVTDIGLLETAIHAFELLCRLQRSGLDFVFKGGTSLLLQLPEIRRLSIDLDIICREPQADFEKILDDIGRRGPFLGWEEDQRGVDRLPKRRHYAVFYPSQRTDTDRKPILIDVVEEPCVIEDLEKKPVRTSFLDVEEETLVTLPTVNALLGDKLTAFAPHTVGVPLNERYSLQVVKQMFDVGELVLAATDLNEVDRAYRAVHAAEVAHRGMGTSGAESLQDTREVCFQLCQAGLRGDSNDFPDDRQLLLRGIQQIGSHLVNCSFNRDIAKISASRAAHLAHILLNTGSHNSIEELHFDDNKVGRLTQVEFPENYRALARLKALPEALYHWSEIYGRASTGTPT